MPVYVDDAYIPFGRMKMCHMIADTEEELHEMAARIGLKREWFQDTSRPHYDIGVGKRHLATRYGAIQITLRELVVKIMNGRRQMVKQPKIVCLCGSSRFTDIMAVVAWLLERDEGRIAMGLHLLPHWYPDVPEHHLAEAEGVAEQMDELHLRKIDLAHEIFVIDWEGYIGESTHKEIVYAAANNKLIRRLTKEPAYLEFVQDALATGTCTEIE